MEKSKKILLLTGLLLVSSAKINNSNVLVNTKYNLEELTTSVITPVNFKKIKQNDSFDILKKFEAVESQKSPKKEETLEEEKPKNPEPPKYDGSKRLNEKTLDEFINFIYKNRDIPKVIDKKFVKLIVQVESGRYVYAKSKVGARGLMQIIPSTWALLEQDLDFHKEAFNPQENLKVGIKYLRHLNNYFFQRQCPEWEKLSTKDKQLLISAAYNGGLTRLMNNDWDITKMPPETQAYVKKIDKLNP